MALTTQDLPQGAGMVDPATAAILDQRYQEYQNSDLNKYLNTRTGDISKVTLQGDNAYIRNFNKLMSMGLVGQAYQYLYDNQRAAAYGSNQGTWGALWNQIGQQVGGGRMNDLINRFGNNAGAGTLPQFRETNTRNWRAYTGLLEDVSNSPYQQYLQQRRANRPGPLRGARAPGGLGGMYGGASWGLQNQSGAQNAATQQGALGDYTFSRYDDGMQHLAQLNDPTWKTFGNPDRGQPIGVGTQPVAPSTPAQPAVPASGGGLSGMYGTFGSRNRTEQSPYFQQQAGDTATQSAPTPTITTQTPQVGSLASYSGGFARPQWTGSLRPQLSTFGG